MIATLTMAAAAFGTSDASQPTNLFDTVFGFGTTPRINKVVILRINPWIGRVISPTVFSFYDGKSSPDSQAVLTDRAGIAGLVHALRDTGVGGEGCYGTSYTALRFPYSWAVLYHDDETNVLGKGADTVLGAVFVSLDGLCVSTGKGVYNVDPDAIGLYLKRTFSFMNF